MAREEHEVLTLSSHKKEPTLASVWYSLAGSSIIDEFLDWPADMFALTEVILGRTEVHRFVLSPPRGADWFRGAFLAGPRRSKRPGGSGACGSRIGSLRSLTSWPRNGRFFVSAPKCRSRIWLTGATGVCARRC